MVTSKFLWKNKYFFYFGPTVQVFTILRLKEKKVLDLNGLYISTIQTKISASAAYQLI